MRSIEAAILHKDAEYLGTIQATISLQLHMLYLRAETMLPHMEKLNLVTPTEYVLLATHAVQQGFKAEAKKYAQQAEVSDEPEILGQVQLVYGYLDYLDDHDDDARKHFLAALDIYDKAKMVAEDQAAEKVQTCVTWCDLEIMYGDKQYQEAEAIIARGEGYLATLRPGALRDSGKAFFERRRNELKTRNSPATPTKAP